MSKNLLPRTREGRTGLALSVVLSLGALAYVAGVAEGSNKSARNADPRTERAREATMDLCNAFIGSGQTEVRVGESIITSYQGRVRIHKTGDDPINFRETPTLQQRVEGRANQDSNVSLRIGDPSDTDNTRASSNLVEFADPIVITTHGERFVGGEVQKPGASDEPAKYKSPADCVESLSWVAVGSLEKGGRYSGAYVEWAPTPLGSGGMGVEPYAIDNAGHLTNTAGNAVGKVTYGFTLK